MYRKQILWFIVIVLAILSLRDLGMSFYNSGTRPTDAEIRKEMKLVDMLFNKAIPRSEYESLYREYLMGISTKDLSKMAKDKNAIKKNKKALRDIEKQALELKLRKLRMLISPSINPPKLPSFKPPKLPPIEEGTPPGIPIEEMGDGFVNAGGTPKEIFDESAPYTNN